MVRLSEMCGVKMQNKLFLQCVAVLLAVMVPAAMMSAETSAAMMYVSGNAVVNGSGVQGSAAIFSGDKLQVPNNASVTVASHGSSILVAPGSSVVFGGTRISLNNRSAVSITTTTGMAAVIDKMKIAPARNGSAKYQVARFSGAVVIAAKEGSVAIVNGSDARYLNAGETATIADPVPEPQKPGSIPTPGAGPAAAAMPTWLAYLLGLAALGAAAGFAIASTGPPASPVTP